jgi:hypothetical protein
MSGWFVTEMLVAAFGGGFVTNMLNAIWYHDNDRIAGWFVAALIAFFLCVGIRYMSDEL